MKTLLLFFSITMLSSRLIAQFTVIQPETFRLALSTSCSATDKGKILYFESFNTVAFCTGQNVSKFVGDHWQGVGNEIYYMGDVGMKGSTPSYPLDITGSMRATTWSGDKLGVNTLTPSEKVEMMDKSLSIISTADASDFRFRYQDAVDRLELVQANVPQMILQNGGNLSISNSPGSSKLTVQGDANFEGNLTVGSNGTVYNSNSAQLTLYIGSFTTSNSFSMLNNACLTSGYNFPAIFSQPPAVAIGQKTAGIAIADEGVVITVESLTNNSGNIRFCNHTGSSVNLSNLTYSLIAIGQPF